MASANSGLVRRRTAVENSADNNGSSTSTSNDHNDNFRDDAEIDNMEETSDKETRLTLMEEVLLLGLKDKEVSSRGGRVVNCSAGNLHSSDFRTSEKY